MKRNGSACSTAVALGVKPSHLKALGPENPWPMVDDRGGGGMVWSEVDE